MTSTKLKVLFILFLSLFFFQCKEESPSSASDNTKLTKDTDLSIPVNLDKIAFQHYNIFLADNDGKNIKNITSGLVDTSYYPHLSGFSSGRTILLFTMDFWKAGAEDFIMSEWDDIFMYDILSAKTIRLTDTKYKELMPSLSPDGKTIVFLSNETGAYHIYTINSDGTGKKLLYASQGWDYEPVFFSDSRTILFWSRTQNGQGLYTINVDGTNLKNLTQDQDNISGPVISKDEKYIYYTYSNGFRMCGIYKYDIAAKSKTKISMDGDGYYQPKISPDGSKVAFIKFDGSWIYVGIMDSDGKNAKIIDKGTEPEFSNNGKTIYYIDGDNINAYDIQTGTKKILIENTGDFPLELEAN